MNKVWKAKMDSRVSPIHRGLPQDKINQVLKNTEKFVRFLTKEDIKEEVTPIETYYLHKGRFPGIWAGKGSGVFVTTTFRGSKLLVDDFQNSVMLLIKDFVETKEVKNN